MAVIGGTDDNGIVYIKEVTVIYTTHETLPEQTITEILALYRLSYRCLSTT